jgi:hypothetical protein
MSILNRASDGLVNVLVALARTSMALGTMHKQKLLDVCSPTSLGDGKQDMATRTLNRWIELGLFTLSAKEEVRIADDYHGRLRKSNASAESIAGVAREIALLPSNNNNFWGDEENKSADFCRALCWMLAQDVHQFIPNSYSHVESRAAEQVSANDVVIFQNDTRWVGFVSWATFLGFGHSDSGKSSGGFIIDPTPAVKSAVRSPANRRVHQTKELPIVDFLEMLSGTLPVLDGGDYRREVERTLRPEKWKAPTAPDVSSSLSRALLRLQSQGLLRLEKRSDSDAQVRLIGRGGNIVQAVTHVQIGDVK